MSRRSLSIVFPSAVTPSFATNAPRPHQLQIKTVEELSSALDGLRVDQARAKQITDVIICEEEEEEEGGEEDKEVMKANEAASSPEESASQSSAEPDKEAKAEVQDNDKISKAVSRLLNHIQHNGGVENFQWTGPDAWSGQQRKGKRPVAFWEALWDVAPTLQNLVFQFHVHELSRMHKAGDVIPPCPTFDQLKFAHIDASMAHGDEGSFLDRWLQKLVVLEELDLRLPSCDLESCRIQGITWNYELPALKSFGLRCYNSNNEGLSAFLHRNMAIEILTWDVETDEPFALAPNSLPNLRSLSISFHGRAERVSSMFFGLAPTPIAHVRMNGCPHDSYAEVAKVAGTLRCLELDLGSGWRDRPSISDVSEAVEQETTNTDLSPLPKLPSIIHDLLPQLPQLQELALDLETANTTIYDRETKQQRLPDPMDENDLHVALRLLAPDSRVRALRMSDSRGVELPAEFLAHFPSFVPTSLEHLKWETATKSALYRLERDAERVRAVECEPVREGAESGFWADKRVLGFE